MLSARCLQPWGVCVRAHAETWEKSFTLWNLYIFQLYKPELKCSVLHESELKVMQVVTFLKSAYIQTWNGRNLHLKIPFWLRHSADTLQTFWQLVTDYTPNGLTRLCFTTAHGYPATSSKPGIPCVRRSHTASKVLVISRQTLFLLLHTLQAWSLQWDDQDKIKK